MRFEVRDLGRKMNGSEGIGTMTMPALLLRRASSLRFVLEKPIEKLGFLSRGRRCLLGWKKTLTFEVVFR